MALGPIGYKNILSIDGSSKPPEPEMIKDQCPSILSNFHGESFTYSSCDGRAESDTLTHTSIRTLYHDTKSKFPFTPSSASAEGPNGLHSDTGAYEAGLTMIGEFDMLSPISTLTG
jgi:translation initiation factor 4E